MNGLLLLRRRWVSGLYFFVLQSYRLWGSLAVFVTALAFRLGNRSLDSTLLMWDISLNQSFSLPIMMFLLLICASSVIDLLVTHLRFINLEFHAVLGCEGYVEEESRSPSPPKPRHQHQPHP